MSIREEFDRWAEAGRDRGMEERHWRTAKQALARMPVEDGDTVVDLGTGSGYALRALAETNHDIHGYGVDASPEMLRNARGYTDTTWLGFVRGAFGALPFDRNAVDHVFSMEAIYYASDLRDALGEIRRVLRSGGTFYCAVDYYDENEYAHEWDDAVDPDLTLWSRAEYREAFRSAGLHVAGQDNLPDRETEIPPEEAFPYRASDTTVFETRAEMVERYRELGTLLTVGVAP
ncbi:MAG: class I SAM-dependent methyltransferase [Halobacteriales archaeon]